MINVKITMVDGTEYNLRNYADSIKDFYKRVFAPYGTNMMFVEILPGTLICAENIISMKEMTDDEVAKINKAEEEPEEVVGLTETEIKVEEAESVEVVA